MLFDHFNIREVHNGVDLLCLLVWVILLKTLVLNHVTPPLLWQRNQESSWRRLAYIQCWPMYNYKLKWREVLHSRVKATAHSSSL